MEKYTDLSILKEKTKKTKRSTSAPNEPYDGVQEYAKESLMLGLLLMDFADATREGDGNRIVRVWKHLLPLFKATGRTNYFVEAFTFLA